MTIFRNIFPSRGLKWSQHPGCFERHLQRRHQNLLFLKDRRLVSSGDLFEAKDRDKKEFDEYFQSVIQFRNDLNKLQLNSLTASEAFKIVHEGTSPLIHKAFEISGQALDLASALFKSEKAILEKLDASDKNLNGLIESWKGLADLQRNHYLSQLTRKDSPILKEESLPALLSEDLETIKFVGWLSRYMPDWKDYKEADVMECLKIAVNEGLNQGKAKVLLEAFREWPAKRPE